MEIMLLRDLVDLKLVTLILSQRGPLRLPAFPDLQIMTCQKFLYAVGIFNSIECILHRQLPVKDLDLILGDFTEIFSPKGYNLMVGQTAICSR